VPFALYSLSSPLPPTQEAAEHPRRRVDVRGRGDGGGPLHFEPERKLELLHQDGDERGREDFNSFVMLLTREVIQAQAQAAGAAPSRWWRTCRGGLQLLHRCCSRGGEIVIAAVPFIKLSNVTTEAGGREANHGAKAQSTATQGRWAGGGAWRQKRRRTGDGRRRLGGRGNFFMGKDSRSPGD
jgi:hypothetical protein